LFARRFYCKWIAVFSLGLAVSTPSLAGFLLVPQVSWSSYGLRAEGEAESQNYFGYGLGLAGGYSPVPLIEFTGLVRYTPGNRSNPGLLNGDAKLWEYGGELGFRLFENLFLGLRGLFQDFNLEHAQTEPEVLGRWQGWGYGVAIGAFFETKERQYLRITLEMNQAGLSAQSDLPDRDFDSFALNFAYVFDTGGRFGSIGGMFYDAVGNFF